MDTDQPTSHGQPPLRESGTEIHRREWLRQILLPFLGAVLLIAGIFLLVGLQNQPIWRIRAQAIGDFLYSTLCLFPVVMCLFPLYVLVLFGIYGMNALQRGTETPLRKLELKANAAADWVEAYSNRVREKTVSYSEKITPVMEMIDVFDAAKPKPTGEDKQHEPSAE